MPKYKLVCPECGCDELEQHLTPKSREDKFKCKNCKKIRPLSKMTYTSDI